MSGREKGPQKSSTENSSQKLADFECRFPYQTPMERTEHHFGPFLEKDFGAISGHPFFSRPRWFIAEYIQTRKKSTNPNFRFRISSLVGWGSSTWTDGGQKIGTSLENPGKPSFWAGYFRIFAWISQGCPKSFRKNVFVFNFWPLDPPCGRSFRTNKCKVDMRSTCEVFWGIIKCKWAQGSAWEPVDHLQGSLAPSGPETAKKSEKSLPGPPAPGPVESLEKVSKESLRILSGLFPDLSRLFRHFFRTLGGSCTRGPGRLSSDFFRGSGPEGTRDPCK